jgi:hypothetical protein
MDTVTGNHKIDMILSVVGALVPLLSALSSFINHMVRVQSASGQQPSPVLLATGSLLNMGAVNIDKGVQLAKMAMGKTVPATAVVDLSAKNDPSQGK